MFTKKRVWIALDVSLGIVAFILFINLFGVGVPEAKATFTFGEAACFYEYQREFTLAPQFERCCWEATKRLNQRETSLLIQDTHLNWIYYNDNGEGNVWMNNKAKAECGKLPFWVGK